MVKYCTSNLQSRNEVLTIASMEDTQAKVVKADKLFRDALRATLNAADLSSRGGEDDLNGPRALQEMLALLKRVEIDLLRRSAPLQPSQVPSNQLPTPEIGAEIALLEKEIAAKDELLAAVRQTLQKHV